MMEWVCEKHGHEHTLMGEGRELWVPVRLGQPTEVCPTFLQGMADRMAVARHRYGPLIEAPKPPNHIDEIAGLAKRMALYEETGNGEYLMDAANFAMIEYMLANHPNFNLTAVEQGPGLQKADGSMTRKTHAERKMEGASGALATRLREGRGGD